MSFPESHDDSPSTAPPPAFYVDPQTLSGLPLSQIVARVGMLEVALRESEDRLRLLVDAVTEYAIFTLDRNGIIESWNTGAERMKGYTHDEALGHHFSMLYPAEARQVDLPQDLLDMARATGSREHSGWQVNKDGATFWSDVVISSMLDDRGNHTGYVIVIRDRTESHRLEVAKDTFYSVFRHDFRMPITAIQGFAELLRDVDHQDQERFVDRIETNAQRLLTMVEGLIDYARLRSGEVPIALQSVDMAALARRAVADLDESTDTSRVTFRGPPSVRVLADPAALEGVVASLLTSALQHSPAGSEITIVCEQVQDAGILTIADQGGGADRGDLRSIFVEFDDANLAHADASASGLGLASVQHHIDLQGGTVDRTSQLDAGTVVRVRLPSAPDAGAMAPEAPQRPPLVRPRPPGDDAPPAVERERSGSGGRAWLPRRFRPEVLPARGLGSQARDASEQALAALLEEAHGVPDYALPELFEKYGRELGAHRVVAYLVDLQQHSLAPFLDPGASDRAGHDDVLSIDRTLAGRAYQHLEVVAQGLGVDAGSMQEGVQVWLPLADGTERLGVLAVTFPDADALEADDGALRARLRTFATVAAELIASKTQYGDSLVRLRRSREMTLAAEMQWSLLPPLTFVSDEVTITGGVEPAYEVGGDTLDYAVDPGVAHMAVFDGMGHGLPSAQLSTLAVSAYRNARRERQGLVPLARFIDTAITSVFGADAFATGVVVELDTDTGVLRWINAGHPAPLLLRNGRLVRTLRVEPMVPFGLGSMVSDQSVRVGTEHLEPGDMVLLYSDGVTEARSPQGGFFGTDKLVELVTRNLAAGLPPSETMRRVTIALLDHHEGHLSDDASLLLLQYRAQPGSR